MADYDKDTLRSYRMLSFKKEMDTLNKMEYILLDFNAPRSELSTKYDYKLIVDDSFTYKFYGFKRRPKTQGSDLVVRINDNYREIGDDNFITLDRGD